ncbi:hypothetical protein [Williamsia phyllosphaerae]|uniref:Uncharacterized protein n=1 Tax=Williamsia phyllosphaerae TaxID=885042 RepID=A0ABQ1UUQ3_9NOCA|nr:hypothetical protein [Williamsia phyllosphaerae]GGF27593.1 hypothetical protein GCM10007298_24310 [Williamsia phyllosphaerae]
MITLSRRIALTLFTFGLLLALGLVAVQARGLPGTGAQPLPADLATPAGAAVMALTGPEPIHALAELGAPPRIVLGYDPVIIDGAPANPRGGCSTPVPLPDRFEPLCKIHDLGYDLLRMAARSGRPLGPWARQRLDHALVEAMHGSCTDPVCEIGADLADVGLWVNTWRQRASVPVTHEDMGSIALSVVVRAAESTAR